MGTYTYIYPITRYGELETEVIADTFFESEEDVMQFYQKPISQQDRKRMLEFLEEDPDADVFQYLATLRDSPNEEVTYGSVMKIVNSTRV